MMTDDKKKKIVAKMLEQRELFGGSDAQYATSLGINASVYNLIKRGDTDRKLSDAKWISIARLLDVELGNNTEWNTANTPVFQYIQAQLATIQRDSSSGILCDDAGIGKSYAARHYARNNRNAVYIDCSQCKTKVRMIKAIAKAFGCNSTGRYYDIYDDLKYYIKTLANPIIILDEAGDLQYEAFLEIKALYNGVEKCCGFYFMGADGLRAKMERGKANKKVGFAEVFNRQGERFRKIVPEGKQAREDFYTLQATLVIKANAAQGVDVKKMIVSTECHLRRVYIEIKKQLNGI